MHGTWGAFLKNDGPYTVVQEEHKSLREYKPGGQVYDMQAKRIEP